MKYDIRPAKVFLQSCEELKGNWNVYLLRAKITELLDASTYKLTYTEYDNERAMSPVTYILPAGQQVKYEYSEAHGWHFVQLKGKDLATYDKSAAKAWFRTHARRKLPPIFRLGPDIGNVDFYGSTNMAFNYIHATSAELEAANRFKRKQFIFISHDGDMLEPQYFLTADHRYYHLLCKEGRLQRETYSFAPWAPYNEKILKDYLKQANA